MTGDELGETSFFREIKALRDEAEVNRKQARENKKYYPKNSAEAQKWDEEEDK